MLMKINHTLYACLNKNWEPARWLEPKTSSGPGAKLLVRGRRLLGADSMLRLKYILHVDAFLAKTACRISY